MHVDWSSLARDDLRAIDEWLTREATPELAERMLAAIRERVVRLSNFPRIGRPHADGARILRVFDTPYLIRYLVDRERVSILRLHHEREDWFVDR